MKIAIELEAQKWQTVFIGLGKLPYEISAPIIAEMAPQLMKPGNGEGAQQAAEGQADARRDQH